MTVIGAARKAAGRVLRVVRGGVTYASWPYLRARAQARVAHSKDWRHCLFICYGNICRSPYAETILRGTLDDVEKTTDSAGFFGPGRPPPDRAIAVALERGWNTRHHQSKLVEPSLLQPHTVVIVMEPWQAKAVRKHAPDWNGTVVNLADLDPERRPSRTIQDPYGGSADDFHRVFEDLERCLDAFMALNGLERRVPPAPR